MRSNRACLGFLGLLVALNLAACGGDNGTGSVIATSYTLGGTVSGLSGAGLVLSDNGGDHLPVTEDGSFTFASKLASGAQYSVTVFAQPNGPAQTCVVSRGSGMVSSDVSSVSVVCTTNTYGIGVTVSGLVGTGLVLSDNGGDDLPVTENGSFAFPTKVASGAQYSVTVFAQPSGPDETCTVSGGNGTVGGSNVSSVSVACTPLSSNYGIAGTYRLAGYGGSGGGSASSDVATLSFDDSGNASGKVSGSQTQNNAGTISTVAISGTYTLAIDGKLTVSPTSSPAFSGTVSADHAVLMADGVLGPLMTPVIQVGVRQGSGTITDSLLSGTYELASYSNSRGSGWSTLSFDGAGHFTGSEVMNNAGTISTTAVIGRYSVASDGGLTLSASSSAPLRGGANADGSALVAGQVTAAQMPSLQAGIKVAPGTYSDGTVRGLYELATWGPSGSSGVFVSFDGAGHYSGGFRSEGTYSVAGDGTLTLSPTDGAALTGRVSASGDMLIATQTTAAQPPTVQVGAQISSVSLGPTLVFACVVATISRCTGSQDTYLVNNGPTPVSVGVILPLGPPFLDTNDCPSSLGPRESCAIRVSLQNVPEAGTYLLRVYESSSPAPHTVAVTVTVR